MGQTRSALTEKLQTLETKVLGTLDSAADNVGQTVHEVGSTMRETAETVRVAMRETASSVRDAFDVSRHVENHPWLMLGGSVIAGYVGGVLLDNLEQGRMPSLPAPPAPPLRAEQLLPEGSEVRERLGAAPPARRRGFGFLRELADAFAPELEKLKAAAVGMALSVLRDKINESVPAQMHENINEMMDRITVKLGGEPHAPGAMYGRSEMHDEGDGARKTPSMGMG
jgi:ElaB/YqjD/DUF883 family membrane-anchored ribosome-binding protein